MFNSEVTITVCGRSVFLREHWAKKFEKFFEASTRMEGVGTWREIREPNILVSHLYASGDNEIDWDAFDVLVKDYKASADQFAVLVVYRRVNGQLF